MGFSKNWESRKAVISISHIGYLKDLAEQTGINSLSETVNYLIAEHRRQENTNTNDNITTSNLSDTADTSSDDNDDFGLGDLI